MSTTTQISKTLSVIDKNGRFENPFSNGTDKKGFSDSVSYLKKRRHIKVLPLTEQEKAEVHPVLKPDFDLINSTYDYKSTIRSTWIGHSTCLVQMEGYNFLTDPVWSKRCSPLSFLGPARYREPACTLAELPNIDFVVISHSHYDHLDHSTVVELARMNSSTKFFVPKGLGKWFKDCGIKNSEEMDWWQTLTFSKEGLEPLEITYTPANHSSQRGLFDRNKYLWGGWSVHGKNQRFFFAGDTAFHDRLFKEVGHHLGPFDLSLIPIGAYDLIREFMAPLHCDVPEAVIIHKDLKSKKSFGVHWGTFQLSSEPLLEPPRLLITEGAKAGLKEKEFFTTKIGETSILVSEPDQIQLEIPSTIESINGSVGSSVTSSLVSEREEPQIEHIEPKKEEDIIVNPI